jgi:hypothetical protein
MPINEEGGQGTGGSKDTRPTTHVLFVTDVTLATSPVYLGV